MSHANDQIESAQRQRRKMTPWTLRCEALFLSRNSTDWTFHLGNTRCTNTLSAKAIEVTSKELKKIKPTRHLPTTQHGSKRWVTCNTAQSHVFMIPCLATSKREKRWKKVGETSGSFPLPTRPHTSFNSIRSWTIFNKGICWSLATPWRSRSCAMPLRHHRRWWNGGNMPWCLSTTIRHDHISHPYKAKSSLLFLPSIDTIGRRKSCPSKEQCAK